MGPEVFHPGEDTVHGAGVAVFGLPMADGISTDCIILIVDNEGNNYVLEWRQKGRLGGAKTTDYIKNERT